MYRLMLLLLCTPILLGQEHKAGETKTYIGEPAMGPNNFMGQPIADLGEPFGLLKLYSVALYNPFGPEPIVVTPGMNIEHPDSAILATVVDPTWAAVGSPIDFPAEMLNVPLHEVPAVLDGIGEVEAPLRGPSSAGQLDPHRAAPYGPITLGKWVEARGTASFECLSNGGAMMTIDINGMLPNSLYTIWGIFGGGGVALIPLGGQPNVMATDENGVDRVKRVLPFCPLHKAEGDRPFLWISIAYHSNQSVYGQVPAPHVWPEGLVHHTQLQFFIDATVLPEINVEYPPE